MKFISLLLFVFSLFTQETYQNYDIDEFTTYQYKKPDAFEFLTNVPSDYLYFYENAFRKENYFEMGLITVSTAVLLKYDEDLITWAQKVGDRYGVQREDNTKTFLRIGDFPIFRGPTDLGSTLYFIGDGWLHMGLSASFLVGGWIKDDNRALQTASQLAQGLVSTAFATQFLKHITGRQSPSRSTTDGGKWDFFPNQIDYHNAVPAYDAFPSGHLATGMMTLTVIAENYPEYTWVKPVGYSLLGLLCFQMMNNKVHWASDYPLAIGLGYMFGKAAVNNGGRRIIDKRLDQEARIEWQISPSISPFNGMGLNLNVQF